ncbi:MAG TPA: PQQ-binding-like beta-propeller repeat protein, partial [Steroidobacteraceae bacterium]|nr:PQQ-binding-like beta-propeller repeat protein [Steroidobacteraceae bacterium]
MDNTSRPPRIFAVLLLLLAVGYLYGGVKLALVGGSYFYALTGITLVLCAYLLWRGNYWGSRLYSALLAVTLAWGLMESGANLWALAPRVAMLAVIGLWFLTPFVRRGLYAPEPPPGLFSTHASKGVAVAALVAVIGISVIATRVSVADIPARFAAASQESQPVTDWQHYGNTTHGTRYAQLDQITALNVDGLKELWHARTGRSGQFKATPLQIGDLLYVCTAMNVVLALDAETGEKRWEFDPKMTVAPVGFNTTCRGVSFHRASTDYQGDCPARILMATTDARLMALNASSGERCKDFGSDGEVSLTKGIGQLKPNLFLNTSPPLIARNLAIVGARVADNLATNEPSGVIRAFDALTGKFVWAWDMGRPGINTEPKEGEEYTRGTPNVWSMMSF